MEQHAVMKLLSYENTYGEVSKFEFKIAILPIGSHEQHSLHLPYCTDTVIISSLAKEVARRLNAFLLPCLPYSSSMEHRGFIGSVWLTPTTLRLVVQDVVESLYMHEVRKIVIMNGHGGNFVLKPTVRELNFKLKGLKLILVDFGFMTSSGVSDDIHSGEFETSLMLYLRPDLVKEAGVDHVPSAPRDYLDYVGLKQLSEKGVWGHPTQASKLKGEEYFRGLVEKAVEYVQKTFEFLDQQDEERNYLHRS